MKTFCKLSLIFLITGASVQWGSAQSDPYTYEEFAKVINPGVLFRLEYGIQKNGYNGYVKWRICNWSDRTVYDVSLADKTYKLSSGSTVKGSGESFTSVLKPGDCKTTIPDSVNSDENYGAYSDKNDNPPTYLELGSPMIRFRLEPDGKQVGWDSVGSVRMNE